MTLRGRILFGDDACAAPHADVILRVEDTTYADAHARTLDTIVRAHVTIDGPGAVVPFTCDLGPSLSAAPPGRRLTLRVVVDLDGDGRLGAGDYVNTIAIPLAQVDAAVMLDVPVRRLA
jgi:hypothetical protein